MLIIATFVITLVAISFVIILREQILVVAPHLIITCDVCLVYKRCLAGIKTDRYVIVIESYHG